jgi:hypothetical protein
MVQRIGSESVFVETLTLDAAAVTCALDALTVLVVVKCLETTVRNDLYWG